MYGGCGYGAGAYGTDTPAVSIIFIGASASQALVVVAGLETAKLFVHANEYARTLLTALAEDGAAFIDSRQSAAASLPAQSAAALVSGLGYGIIVQEEMLPEPWPDAAVIAIVSGATPIIVTTAQQLSPMWQVGQSGVSRVSGSEGDD